MKRIKVLIIDDLSSMRGLIREGLAKSFAGILIDEAADGREAQEKLAKKKYDLVLCDWIMPDIGGDQLLRWIRSHSALRSLPFIMITSKSDKNSILEALRIGANDYIVKPFTIEGLAEKILKIIP